jgi:arginine deiminase
MGHGVGTDSEVGQLRAVLVHRPGPELQRLTPRHRKRLLLRGLPWLARARQEHDLLTQALRDQGVEVLYLTELLQDCLEYQAARDEAITVAVADARLGDDLRSQLRAYLDQLGPEALAQVLIAGLTAAELKIGHGVVFELLDRHDFVLDPLPNLLFTRDSSVWLGAQVAIASLGPRRRRESSLAGLVYRHHPRFGGTTRLYQPGREQLDGGDVLLLGPGVLAVGVGERTTAAAAERLARNVFDAGLAHTVLAVPMLPPQETGHLDTVCTVIDSATVLMHPAWAYSLTAHAITPRPGGMRVSRPRPFLEAAARAMEVERLAVIDAGTEVSGGQDRWDDGSNVLAIRHRVVISHERNWEANARLEDAGVQVIRVPSSELASVRGGPRCMSCAMSREPAARQSEPAVPARPLFREKLVLAASDAATSQLPTWPESPAPAAAPAAVSAAPAAAAVAEVPYGLGREPELGEEAAPARTPDQRASEHLDDGQSRGREEELASASLESPRRQRRREDHLPTRNIPKARPMTNKISANVISHHSTCRMATATKTSRMAPPINIRMRSMTTRYGCCPRLVSSRARRGCCPGVGRAAAGSHPPSAAAARAGSCLAQI